MFDIFVSSSLLIFVYMTLWFSISLVLRRNDVADFAWGLGFIVVSCTLSLAFPYANHLNLISLLISVWGIRLSSHIYKRLKRSNEDERYANWRKEWGKNVAVRSYLQVFILQGLFMFLICFPVFFSVFSSRQLGYLGYVGILVWLFGFLFESVSDYQLANFVKIKKPGQVMQSGLWHYSRHPNYFGEVVSWWGIGLISLEAGLNLLSFVGPLTITCLILFVSGVPLLEKKYENNLEFKEYKKRTSVFVPWFSKV